MTKFNKKIIFSLACITVLIFVGVYFYSRQQNYTIPVAVLQEEGNGQALGHPVQEMPTGIIILLCYDTGLSYDYATGEIALPYGAAVVSIEHSYIFHVHTITLDGVHFPRRFRLLVAYCPLVALVIQNGNTITIHTQYGATINYNGGYIKPVNLRDIYHTIILIDPGHGGHDPGAPNVLGGDYPSEADIVLAISQKLLYIFDEPGILLIPTRTTDEHVAITARIRMANRLADYFISIHANADGVSRNSGGTLTLYGRAAGSAEFAYTFQNALVYALGSFDRGISDTPAVMILRYSNIPVALLELLFLSNPEEAARLSDPDTQLFIANTLANAIRIHVDKDFY